MKCILTTAILLAGYTCPVFAQNNDAASTGKQYEHVIGVQINGLINQVFNFSNTTPAANANPYLLTYNITSVKSGWGLRVGIGYNYNSSSTNDNINFTTTKLNDIHARIGIEKRFKLEGKWSAGAGLDFVYNSNDDNTNTETFQIDTVTTNTKTTVSSYGGGIMGWLRYSITKNLTLGTETSFYYVTGNQKNNYSTTENKIVIPPTQTSNNLSTGTISLPIVFYLAVKF